MFQLLPINGCAIQIIKHIKQDRAYICTYSVTVSTLTVVELTYDRKVLGFYTDGKREYLYTVASSSGYDLYQYSWLAV